jgi:acyl-ACP thioesterase
MTDPTNRVRTQLEMVPVPLHGRTYVRKRSVRLGDVNPHGRMRLDAVARAVQDIATADATEALSGSAFAYVLRRLWLVINTPAQLGETLTLTTFCGGMARSWAERRTSLEGDRGAQIEAAAIWVPIDTAGRPTRLPEDFLAAYGEAANGRRVEARRTHGDSTGASLSGAEHRQWAIRYSDLDTLGHVNNAAHWCAVEDVLAGRPVKQAEIEFVGGLMMNEPCTFMSVPHADGLDSWLCAEGHVRSSQRVWF